MGEGVRGEPMSTVHHVEWRDTVLDVPEGRYFICVNRYGDVVMRSEMSVGLKRKMIVLCEMYGPSVERIEAGKGVMVDGK